MPDYEFTQYRRKQIAELRPYIEGEDVSHVSISPEDAKAGSPKPGDMIARNPKNHADQWLVARDYFLDNFEAITAEQAETAKDAEPVACVERGSEQSTPQPESRLREARLREALERVPDEAGHWAYVYCRVHIGSEYEDEISEFVTQKVRSFVERALAEEKRP